MQKKLNTKYLNIWEGNAIKDTYAISEKTWQLQKSCTSHQHQRHLPFVFLIVLFSFFPHFSLLLHNSDFLWLRLQLPGSHLGGFMGGVLSSSARELPDLPTTVIRTGGAHKLGNLAIIIVIVYLTVSSLFSKLPFNQSIYSAELIEKKWETRDGWKWAFFLFMMGLNGK